MKQLLERIRRPISRIELQLEAGEGVGVLAGGSELCLSAYARQLLACNLQPLLPPQRGLRLRITAREEERRRNEVVESVRVLLKKAIENFERWQPVVETGELLALEHPLLQQVNNGGRGGQRKYGIAEKRQGDMHRKPPAVEQRIGRLDLLRHSRPDDHQHHRQRADEPSLPARRGGTGLISIGWILISVVLLLLRR